LVRVIKLAIKTESDFPEAYEDTYLAAFLGKE
jgi:hypothetical protein